VSGRASDGGGARPGDEGGAAGILACLQCGSCAASCPVQAVDSRFNVRRLLRSMQLGRLDGAAREDIWACAQCMQCTALCPQGARPDEAILRLRREAAQLGEAPPQVEAAVRNVLRWQRPLPLPADLLTKWATDLSLPTRGETLFLAGLYPYMPYVERVFRAFATLPSRRVGRLGRVLSFLYPALQRILPRFIPRLTRIDARPYHEALRGAVLALEAVGVKVAYLGETEPWCGIELHTYGYEDEFAVHARRVRDTLLTAGAREIVTPDVLTASCLETLYPHVGAGLGIPVRHLSEVMAERMANAKGRWRARERQLVTTFSDPCYLARRLQVVDEPRRIFQRIEKLHLKEAHRHGPQTRCVCGGGSELARPENVAKMADLRFAELISDTGAERVVTSCPVCVMMLRLAGERAGYPGPVQDLGQLLLEVLPEKSGWPGARGMGRRAPAEGEPNGGRRKGASSWPSA
jgi:Fe-S oxidoreductase